MSWIRSRLPVLFPVLLGCRPGADGLSAPRDLAATVVPPATVELTWLAAGGEDGVRVERGPLGEDPVEIARLDAGAVSYTDATVAAEGAYTYRVVAFAEDEAGSDLVEVRLPPNAPTGLTAEPTWSDRVALAWTDASAIETGYAVRRRPAGGEGFTTLDTLDAGATVFEDDDAAGGSWDYAVVAVSGHGDSPAAEVLAVPMPVTAPQGLAADPGSTHVTLSWTDAALETGLRVERGPSAGALETIATLPADAVGYTDDGLTPETGYVYRVVAFNGTDESPTEAETTTTAVGCATLTDLSPSATFLDADGAITATFDDTVPAADASTFVVRGSQSGLHTGTWTGGWPGDPLDTLTSPAGMFVAGETVEVTITSAHACTPHVARYQVRTAPSSGDLVSDLIPFDVGSRLDWLGDLDGDGDADGLEGGIVYLNEGGLLEAQSQSPLTSAGDPRPAHVDDDGDLDFVLTSNGAFSTDPNEVVVLSSDGLGGFDVSSFRTDEPDEVLGFVGYIYDHAVGDVDGDDLDDVVVSIEGHGQQVLLSDGEGGLVLGERVDSGESTRISLADLGEDGNGDLDVLTYDEAFYGEGDGTFADTPTEREPGGILAHVDLDGWPDLVRCASATELAVHLGDGAGGFGSGTPSTVTNCRSDGLFDLDGDGRSDLVTWDTGDHLTTWLVDDAQAFTLAGQVDLLPGESPQDVIDVDGDGHVDLVLRGDAYRVLAGDGTGTFTDITLRELQHGHLRHAVADVDGDGVPDLVTAVAHPTDDGTLLTTVLGDGVHLAAHAPASPSTATAELPDGGAFAAGDLDGDGDADLVLARTSGGAGILLGNGDGTFSDGGTAHTTDGTTRASLGDLNGDGHLDLFTVGAGSAVVAIGDGVGGLSATPFDAPDTHLHPDRHALGDVDGDGDLDVVSALDGALATLLNDGTGAFSTGTSLAIQLQAAPVLGDLDGDGDLDAVSVGSGSALVVLLNDGTGQYALEATGPPFTPDLHLADLDGDGHLDLVNALSYQSATWWGDGTGGFQGPSTRHLPGLAWLELVDVDGDGALDVVTWTVDDDEASLLVHHGVVR